MDDNEEKGSAENPPGSGEQPQTDTRPKMPVPVPTIPGKPATEQTASTSPTGNTGLATEIGRSGGGGRKLGRPARTQPRASRRKRGVGWGWLLVVGLAIAAGVGTFIWARSTQTSTVFQGLTTSPSTRQPVTLAVSASGQIQANADVALSFGSSGTVREVNVKLGDRVKQGQVLARLDDTDLQNSVKSAKASLEQQQASYNKTASGATQKEIEQAQAQVKQAQAKYDQTKNGNALPAEINSTNASIRSAQAQLNSAQAKLAQDLQGGSPADKAAAQSAVSSAQAQLASAQAQLASAQAKLAKDQAGPDYATVTSAQAKVDQAQASLDKTKSNLQYQVVAAEVARDQALNALRNAQDKYRSAYNDNHNADGSLKGDRKQSDIDNENSLYRALQDAQGTYNKADIALNDARVAYDTGVKSAQSQLDDAKASLDKTKAGSTPADLAADEASVSSAQSQIASAQSSLDSAIKTQAALTATDATIASDQASISSAQSQIASAQSSLAKLTGGTPSDIASSQASLDSANAALNDLLVGAKPNDLAVSQAQVNQAQASYDNAVAKLTNAIITAPFDGVIVVPSTSSNLPVVGQSVNASASLFELIDYSSLHVDVNVGENDIAKVKLGQAVAVNLDALSGQSFTGKITYISSKSSVSNNVVNFLVTVTLDANGSNTFQEVWGSELVKYLQGLAQAQGQPGQSGQNGATGGFPGGAPPDGFPAGAAPAGGFPAGGFPGGFPGGAGGQAGRIPASLLSQLGVCGYVPLPSGSGDNQTQPKAGMTASVTICQNMKAGVLTLPNRALKTKTENGRQVQYVQVLINKQTSQIEDRAVTTGLAGDSYTEITGGNLSTADLVVLSSTPSNRSTQTFNFPIPG
jgi:HlyD family secretion protein